MGGRHTPIPLQFDAHGLKITSISLSEPSLEVFSGEGPLTFPPAGRCLRRGGGGGYKNLRCHILAQRWMKLDDFNHELPSASDAGLHV
jgi:hypothetical protein